MKPCQIELLTLEQVPVFFIKGYFTEAGGKQLVDMIDGYLEKGQIHFVVDFGGCQLINSPGVVAIVTLAMKVCDDFKGKLVLTGLDEFKTSVLNVAGVFCSAEYAGTSEEGIKKVKNP
jgi:hypothetical protein